ncbi:MAG: hypothetical protein ONB23_09200 [candidate division KSB1 bacterium]|nr:hypothetical protein [candidate division KSB1 bacterium]
MKPKALPIILEVNAPQVVSPYQICSLTAKVSHPEGVRAVRHVVVEVYPEAGGQPLATDTLYDDGAYYHPSDGDVVAGDGLFTGRLVWRWSGPVEATYRLTFRAEDREGHQSESVERRVTARRNHPPEILQVEAPPLLPSGFEGDYRFRILVADSDGIGDVAEVRFSGLRGEVEIFAGRLYDDGSHGDPAAGDGCFELRLTSEFGAGKKGEYRLQFVAIDRIGARSAPAERSIRIENEPPEIVWVDAPDSVAKPLSGSVAFRILAAVRDPQGLSDVREVGFTSRKPDGSYANNGNPIPMVDNGLPFDPALYPQPYFGDETAGDGVYTFTMVVYSDAEAARAGLPPVALGSYRFSFRAVDWVGQQSETVEKILVVY